MKLFVKTSQQVVCTTLKKAEAWGERTMGLIGTKHLDDEGLWIARCNWIHTFFMSIPIDVLYIDKNMVIKKVDHSVRPWRLPAPVFSARSVIELPAGTAKEKQLKAGDQLHVGH